MRARANAAAMNIHGLYVLISKNDHKVWVEPSRSAENVFSKPKLKAITDSIVNSFKAKKFDQGLLDAVAEIQKDAGGAVVSGVRDRAGMFSADAVKTADREIEAIRRESHWQVAIETVPSLEGKPIAAVAVENARSLNIHGLYVLIAKAEHKVYVEPSPSAEKVFTKAKIKAIVDAIEGPFRSKDFDKGLLNAAAEIRKGAVPASERAVGKVSGRVRRPHRHARTRRRPLVRPSPCNPSRKRMMGARLSGPLIPLPSLRGIEHRRPKRRVISRS